MGLWSVRAFCRVAWPTEFGEALLPRLGVSAREILTGR
jgi:hypothetical protein